MTAPDAVPGDPPPAARPGGTELLDGEWHRLHPATPLLRGGVALIAIIAFVIANLRERLVEIFIPDECDGPFCAESGDPLDYVFSNGYVLLALVGVLVTLLVLVAGFYVSWRLHTFRVTDELVEVRSGILFRTHRKARLDRIQGINIVRPLVARIFGAAKLEVNVAGQDANVQLAYLSGQTADALRAQILRLASGARTEATAPSDADGASAGGTILDRRLAEFTAPELDPTLAAPQSVVSMPASRLIGSTVLSGAAVFIMILLVLGVAGLVLGLNFGWVGALLPAFFGLLPAIIGAVSFAVNRILKSLRFTIASTPDGVRVGYGLFSTSNETLPPGRIHSISVSQPLLWRPFDWWEVKVNRAGTSSAEGAAGRQNTTILPVGTRADAFRVLDLVLPGLDDPEVSTRVADGLGRGGNDGYTTSPRRAAVLRWFSWRRNGFALTPSAVLVRRGAIWRELVIVPAARMQSVALTQGPLERALRVAVVQAHTVAGPISARLGAIDHADAERFFRDVAALGVAAATADRSERWRSGEASA